MSAEVPLALIIVVPAALVTATACLCCLWRRVFGLEKEQLQQKRMQSQPHPNQYQYQNQNQVPSQNLGGAYAVPLPQYYLTQAQAQPQQNYSAV